MERTKQQQRPSPRPLFAHWPRLAVRIRRAKRLILFLDFDGTLVGFKKNPEEVWLDSSTRQLLEGLARNPRVSVVFISGRRREDLRRRVRVTGGAYIGLHGFERSAGARLSAQSRCVLRRVAGLLRNRTRSLPGVWLEDKGASLVLHYRGAPAAAAARARARAERILKTEGVPLGVLRGKKIIELLAPEVKGKGAASAEVVRALGDGALAVYVGDDATDETAFAALGSGITVRVGRGRHTLARYSVRNPDEVRMFLNSFTAAVNGPGVFKSGNSGFLVGSERGFAPHPQDLTL